MDMIESLQGFVEENLSLLAPVDQAWQPTDYLPDLTAEDWSDRLSRFREASRGLADDLLVILVGNMVTEEALPNYSVSLERVVRDPTGTGEAPWSQWLRGWTAEENRHGDLLNAYLRLTGRVDMRAVEVTVHHLIRNGFNPRSRGNDYAGLIYAAFQERATRVSHGAVGKLAAAQGDDHLAAICKRISADEARHEAFYTRVVGRIMEDDPEGAILAYRGMLKGIIAMPGRLMTDGRDPDLFDHFSAVTQRSGVYTVRTYAQIIRHLNDVWGVAGRPVTGKAAKAQDYLCQQPERYENLSGEIEQGLREQPRARFSWLRGCEV